jgi:hypothetical protein
MRLRTALLTGLVASTLAGAVPAVAAPLPALLLQSRSDQAAVVRAFRAVVRRDPNPLELRRYALLMDDYGWTEADVRSDLAERTDYRRYSDNSSYDTDGIIRRAYRDILGREPDPAGFASYRKHIIQEQWSEQDVREALRRSPEYRSGNRRNLSADTIIRRAYLDILKREPDPDGLRAYRRAILDDGWDEHDVRQALRRSEERRERGLGGTGRGAGRSQDYVTETVRNAYRAVLGREPDAAGLHDYGLRVTRDNWTQAQIERALRDSPEYRSKH